MDADQASGPKIGSVAELIDFRDGLRPQDAVVNRPLLAFRGQPREFGTLTPSFQRQFSRQSHGTAVLIEARLIGAFREHYAALRDRSPDMPSPSQIAEGYDLRCLSVMQHYEIPTRLLDWTSDFWTAIYFACASEPSSNAEVWYYDRELFERQRSSDSSLSPLVMAGSSPPPEPPIISRRGENLIVELDPQLTPRMVQQYGHHTVSTNPFADHAPLIAALHQSLNLQSSDIAGLQRIVIDGASKSNILQFLAQEVKITASTIFPDVVGLGRFLRWQFDSLRTMYL